MSRRKLGGRVKKVALDHGADLVGVVKVSDLPEDVGNISRIAPFAKSVIVVASRHSLASLRSPAIQLAQFDTIHAYSECARSAHAVSRFLEREGYPSVAVPAFIPIDMEEPKKGMRGELCWRRAGVRAGIGTYGESGLLVTREFGSAVRISGVLSSADLEADSPLGEDACVHCMRCVESCPSGALSGGGAINKKLCGETIFKYGFRFFQRFMRGLHQDRREETGKIIDGFELREMWQTFMTGNYYYCFECQSKCPTTLAGKTG